jgi:hypothetical protein
MKASFCERRIRCKESVHGGLRVRAADRAPLRGVFRIRARDRNGNIVWQDEDHNMIVDGARYQMARLVAGDTAGRKIASIAFGENGDAATVSDMAITVPVVKTIASVEYPQNGQVQFNWTLGTDEANGKAILEFGLLCEDGVLFARYVRPLPLNKLSDFSLEGDWTIIF